MAAKATGFRHAAWRALILLFALVAIALHKASAMTSSDICVPEAESCLANAECQDCLYPDDMDAYIECAESIADDGDDDVNVDFCRGVSAAACCQDAVSENNCLANEQFVEYTLCTMALVTDAAGLEECTAITCSGVEGVEGVVGEDDSGAAGAKASPPSPAIAFTFSIVLVAIPAFVKSV
ncbi:unnamed protein product [Scytosiphon promiscuus]